MTELLGYALRLADDALIAAQRLAECVANAPQIEQDVACANVALDLLGQARACYAYAGAQHPEHPSEDYFAYSRADVEFTNVQLVELPNADFAFTVTRSFALAGYQRLLYSALVGSVDPDLAAIAGKAGVEVAYHFTHFAGWVVRLGDGTEESRQRMQRAVDAIWPYTYEMFESDELTRTLAARDLAPDPPSLAPDFLAAVRPVIDEATLRLPESGWRPSGGRSGRHTEGFGYLIAEMQSVARAHPGASW